MRRLYRNRTLKPRAWLALAAAAGGVLLTSRMLQVEAWPDAGAGAVAVLRVMTMAPAAIGLAAAGLLLCGVWRGVGVFDVDFSAGRFRLRRWRPLGWREIEGRLDEITDWHYRLRKGPGGQRRAFRARLADPPLALYFDIRRHGQLGADWRRIAPGAVAAYERETGLTL